LKDLKEKYVGLLKQQESTLLDLKASEEGLSRFDFVCKIYEEKHKFLCQKLQEKCNGKSLSKHESTFFVPEGAKLETVVQLEPEASSSKAKITSKPKNSKPNAMINSDTETSKIKILKRSELVPQSLLKPESEVLKFKCQKNKTVVDS